jgi:hypothetical protein
MYFPPALLLSQLSPPQADKKQPCGGRKAEKMLFGLSLVKLFGLTAYQGFWQ